MSSLSNDTTQLFTVHVQDGFGRKRTLTVGYRGDRVVLVAPPGEGCTLSPQGAAQLIGYVREARRLAKQNRPTTTKATTDADSTTTADTTGSTTATNSRRPGDAPRHPGDTSRPSVPNHGERPPA